MNKRSHLSSEQIECVLAGSPDDSLQEHLSQCVSCHEEIEQMRAVFGSLRDTMTVTAQSQRRSAAPRERKSAPRLAWAAALAVLVVGLMIPLSPLAHLRRGETPAARPTPPAETLSDEALLNGIQKDLSTSVPEPLEPLAGTQRTTQKNRAQ
jgi:hypothetical protein